jgi:hypothetical protein
MLWLPKVGAHCQTPARLVTNTLLMSSTHSRSPCLSLRARDCTGKCNRYWVEAHATLAAAAAVVACCRGVQGVGESEGANEATIDAPLVAAAR